MKAVTKRLLATILSLCSAICVYCGLTLSGKTVHAATDFNITGVSAYNVNDDRFYVVLSTDVEIQSAGQQRITVSVEKAGVTEEIAVTFNAFSNADIQIPTSAVAKTGEKGFVTIPNYGRRIRFGDRLHVFRRRGNSERKYIRYGNGQARYRSDDRKLRALSYVL